MYNKEHASDRLLDLRNKPYDHRWNSKQKIDYQLANSNLYDRKSFEIPRPFPIGQIYFETFSNPPLGSLLLRYRTHLGKSMINHALRFISWNKGQNRNIFDDRRTFEFDLNSNNIEEIKSLFMAIFKGLQSLSDIEIIQNSLMRALHEMLIMLDVFQIDFDQKFPGINFFLNGRNQEKAQIFSITDKDAIAAEQMYKAVFYLDTAKVLALLEKGVNPNIYFQGYTPLIATIQFGIDHAFSFKGRNKKQLLPEVLSIIRLLLEYGAKPMYESYYHTAMEALVIWLSHRHDCMIELCAAILQLLTAGNGIQSHITVSEEAQKEALGLIVSGANCFLKSLPQKNSPRIIACFKADHLYFETSFNTCITVKTVILNNLTQQAWQNLFKNKALYELFARHFPTQPLSYFQELLEKNTSAIDMIYMDNQLVGMNIVDIILLQSDETFILHYIKLAAADKDLRIFPRFMSLISFSRSFSFHHAVTYYEAASSASYLQTCNLDIFPKMKNLQPIMECIGKYLYPEKLLFTDHAILVQDELAVVEKPTFPLLFWDSNPEKMQKLPAKINQDNINTFFSGNGQLSQSGFNERLLQNRKQYDVAICFRNNPHNLQKLGDKINPHCSGIFTKVIDYFREIGPNPATFIQPKL